MVREHVIRIVRPQEPAAAYATVVAAFGLGAALACLAWMAWQQRQEAGPLSDDTLRQRVRARVGALVTQPDNVVIDVEDGVVRLSGFVAPAERDALLETVKEMPGVLRVRSALSTLRRVA